MELAVNNLENENFFILFGILVLAFLGNAALWLVGLLLGIKLFFAVWDLVYLGLVLKNA